MPGFDGTGPAGMGPMTGGGRGWCLYPAGYNPYSPLYAGYGPYPAPTPYAYGPYAPGVGMPAWGYGMRPRWGLRGFWGRGIGWGGRGRGRGRW